MSATRAPARTSPSRIKSSSKNILQPAQISLPPSPPTSDALAPPSSSPPPLQREHPVTGIKPTNRRSSPRRRDNPQSLQSVTKAKPPINQKHPRTRPIKHPSPTQEQLESSSPPTSPTTRQSLRPTKRLKLSSSPTPRPSKRLPLVLDNRDSPNNPFLVKPGEKKRRAGAKADDAHRQLVYVFRGKRIPYETTEDLSRTGGSPFGTSAPKLLFPSPPSPAPGPARKLQFEGLDQIVGGSDLTQGSPKRDNSRHHIAFQTPKRDKLATAPSMLPTPQSHPRKAASRKANFHALSGAIKSSRATSKIIR